MTTTTPTPVPAPASEPTTQSRVAPRLVFAELRKSWTTNMWWILAICAVAAVGLALALNATVAHFELESARNPPDFSFNYAPGEAPPPEELERQEELWRSQYGDVGAVAERSAANIYTSGQYFGLLLVLLFGAMLVTSEFYHQTATATFLATPRRTRVIAAKLAAGVSAAGGAWLVSTLINLTGGVIFFSVEGVSNGLGDWPVQRAILMNLLAYAIWAVLGIGLGALIRSQLGATITGAGLYLIGATVVQVAFFLVYQFWIKEEWVLNLMVLAPSVASEVMVSPQVVFGATTDGQLVYGPQWWVGALILLGYGVVAGLLGNLLLRKRDIS